jgi:hypothetical protein
MISEGEWKRIFLQAVPENRELLANQRGGLLTEEKEEGLLEADDLI